MSTPEQIQHNSAVKYIERNQIRLKLQTSRALFAFLGSMLLAVFYYFVRLILTPTR
jgi:hypothetical protein